MKKLLPYVKKNWWIVLLFAGISLLAGDLYDYKLDKVYDVSTQLLLKSNEDYSAGSLITDNRFYGNTTKTFVDNSNEMRILQSHDLVDQVLDRLDFDVSYYLVGRLRTTEVYAGVPFSVKISSLNPELYEQQIRFRILTPEQYEMTFQVGGQSKTVKGFFDKELLNPYMKLMVSQKRNVLNPHGQADNLANYIIQPHRKEDLAQKFLSETKIENPEYTNVLKVSCFDVLPEKAMKFLDTLSEVYIENSINSKLDINKNTVYFIDRQLDEVANILNNIEDTLQDFREKNSVIDLDRQSQDYFDKYSSYLDQKKNLEIQIGTLDDLEKYVIENKDPSFLPPAAYSLQGDEFQISTLQWLYDRENKLKEELNIARPGNFAVQNLKNQIDSTKRDLLIYISNTRTALGEKMDRVDTTISFYDGLLNSLPEKERGMLNISRKQKVNEDIYVFLLQRRANTVISRASIVPDTKIIERPRVNGIVSPDDKKIIISFLGGGVALAFLLVFIRIFYFHRIETYDELKLYTQLPIIGDVVISKIPTDLSIAVEFEPKSPLAESFRTIRTNLQYMATGSGPHVIVITSNSPGEGKTFCSLNLAAVLAKSGKKTVLVELDLHKPRIQTGLGIKSEKGISTIASGRHTIAECVVQTKIEGLDAILSGPLPPNPSELVSSKQIDLLLEYCKANYEFVIIDTPPVGLISDAMVLMTKANVLLFVMNTKYAFRHALQNATEIAMLNQDIHFGFILNGVKRKKSRYYYSHYGYGYGYGSYGGGYGGYGGYGQGSYGGYGGYGTQNKPKKKK
ncbi:MAG TPA: polysaccharide biosynthesis tyrosine autokinase [Bacteroidia bacterium]|nr:polysaccharide biosynthesis tyrosine autokinase [Bacteroidia bacterium]